MEDLNLKNEASDDQRIAEKRKANDTGSAEGKVKTLDKRKCVFFIEKKKRQCQLLKMKGYDYCAEHFVNDDLDEDSTLRRIPCPYDPKHTCCVKLLDDHLKRCNMRPKQPPPYYSKEINSTSLEVGDQTSSNLSELSTTKLNRLVSLIHFVYHNKIPKTALKTEVFGSFETMKEHINTPDFGHSAKRHLVQASSLLSFLQTENLLSNSTCFIELGSGKGLLTYHLAQGVQVYVKAPDTCRFVLVDRASHRHKIDNKLKDFPQIIVERLRIDLADLMLGKVDSVEKCVNTVGFSKHLCGAATDMALKCILENNSKVRKVKGIVIATCCHHQCTWGSYVGKDYMKDWGFQPQDFKALTGISSWAVCGTGTSGFDDTNPNITELDGRWMSNGSSELSPSVKRTLGIYAKRIMDYGRTLYINTFGFNTKLATYASLEDTLENMAIVARASEVEKPNDSKM